MYTSSPRVPVRRLQLDAATCTLVAAPKKEPFLRGPIPLEWLRVVASLPGKTINVALALWWRHGMAQRKSFKLSRLALMTLNVERDAERKGVARLEQAGLIHVERMPGQRPIISLLDLARPAPSQPFPASPSAIRPPG